jgi:hypothetical protein
MLVIFARKDCTEPVVPLGDSEVAVAVRIKPTPRLGVALEWSGNISDEEVLPAFLNDAVYIVVHCGVSVPRERPGIRLQQSGQSVAVVVLRVSTWSQS